STTVSRLDTTKTTIAVGDRTLKVGADFDAYLPAASLSGQIEYVGFGYRAPSRGVDPYAGRDVRGKILLVLSGLPKEFTQEELFGGKITDAEFPTQMATKLGAKGILIVKEEGTSPSITVGGAVPNIVLKSSALAAIMAGESISADELIRRLRDRNPGASASLSSSKNISVNIAATPQTLTYKNVVGIIPGSDAKLKSEYVAFGAHYDHVGVHGEGPGDHIWNGADDDGSGTVAILEIAHAYAIGPRPKRSLLFVWHAGEEKGLWGSDYFVAHPTVPLANIVTQLNIDMIGRSRGPADSNPANANLSDRNSIYVIGSRMLSDDLGNAVVSVNQGMNKLNLDYKYDDPKDPEHFYERSDHYNYAKKGIPIAFFFNGVHEDYHGAGDEVSKIDFVRMEKITRTVYAIGWQVGNTVARPKVNKPVNSG
ncbi:MAG: M28 family peptidase, partial [Fimbriimonadaceae bacterium]